MADRRRAEIEEKRAKLAELRRARDERKALLAQAQSGGDRAADAAPLTTSRRDVNDLVDSLLAPRPGSPAISQSRTIPSASAAASVGGRATPPLSSSVPGTPGGRVSRLSNEGSVRDGRESRAGGTGSGSAVGTGIGMGVTGLPGADREGMFSPGTGGSVDFVDMSAELYELPSKAAKPPPVTYSKAIQTSSTGVGTSTDLPLEDDDEARPRDGGNGRETEDEMRKRILEELEVERSALEKELREIKEKEEKLAELSNEQRQAIFAAPDFTSFIEESTKIVQRALSDGYDYIRDYTVGLEGAFDDAEGQKVKLFCAFSDDRWTANRSVTDLDWSPKFPELAVASYNKNLAAPNDPDGIVAVWNLHLLERPEFVFHSPSDVLSVTFSPFHPTLIFGGSYSGQVLLWDTRAKHLPVLKTPLSAAGHTYPIYAMKMVGTQNANNLISTSTDGLVCSWLADMLSQPQEALPLTVTSHNKSDEVSITALDFPESETSTFWIGTEEGSIYQAHRYDRATAKAGLNADEVYRGHAGPVTGLDFHPSSGNIDFSDLFLSSSVDWTVKLWRTRAAKASTSGSAGAAGAGESRTQERDRTASGSGSSGAGAGAAGGSGSGRPAPLHSFEEADDYVFDVKWHPQHPAMFGSVDGTGKFDLWNLNHDAEIPIVSTSVSDRALNKLAWDRTPLSRKVGLGGSDGKLYVYDVAEKLVSPRDSEWAEMQNTVAGLAARESAGLAAVELPPVQGRYTSLR